MTSRNKKRVSRKRVSRRRSNKKRVSRRKTRKSPRRYRSPKMAIGKMTKWFSSKTKIYPFYNGNKWNFNETWKEPTDLCQYRLDKSDPVYTSYEVYFDADPNVDNKTSNLYFYAISNKRLYEKGVKKYPSTFEVDQWAYQVVAKSRSEADSLVFSFERDSGLFPKDFLSNGMKREEQIYQDVTVFALEKEYPSRIIEFSHTNDVKSEAYPNYEQLVKKYTPPNEGVYRVTRKFFEDFKL